MSINKISSAKPDDSASKIIVYTDGASRGNPGPAGAGVAIGFKNKRVNLAVFLGKKTNNEAEYLAVLIALKYIDRLVKKNDKKAGLRLCRTSLITIKLDSQLVVNQLNGDWKTKDSRMRQYVSRINSHTQELPCPVRFEHIGREKNKTADWLANQALDLTQDELA